MADPTTLLAALGAVTAVVATVIAAYNAYLARQATDAALESVQEARRSRRDQILPRLILEREFFQLQIQWPHGSALEGEPVLRARRDWWDEEVFVPTFSLSNYGDGPAVAASLTFELEVPNGDHKLSEAWESLGIRSEEASPADPAAPPFLHCKDGGKEWGRELCTSVTVPVPSCPPGRPRTIEFPYDLAGTIFMRGLQYLDREGKIEPLILKVLVSYYTIEVSYYAPEAELLTAHFRFKICPQASERTLPAYVVAKVEDLAVYPPDAAPGP